MAWTAGIRFPAKARITLLLSVYFSGLGVKLTTHLYKEPRSGMGELNPIPTCLIVTLNYS
jgi:hypothetical protein